MENTKKTALVTGSSSGIGAAIAKRLSASGMRVVINSARSVEAGRKLANELPDATYVRADITRGDQVAELVRASAEWGDGLDVVVNNAGTTRIIPHTDLDAVTGQVWREILDLNVVGTWQVSAAAAPHLARRGGCIVNISSVAGGRPVGSSIPYAVSKAAINHMTGLLAKALGPDVRVNAVAPALTETPWTRDDPFFQEIAEHVRRSTPMRRVGTAEEVADAVAAVVATDFMTGTVVPVDGGAQLV